MARLQHEECKTRCPDAKTPRLRCRCRASAGYHCSQVLQGWKSNYVPLDKRSWLEVHDKHHRYAKNLRLYFKVRRKEERAGVPVCVSRSPAVVRGGKPGRALPSAHRPRGETFVQQISRARAPSALALPRGILRDAVTSPSPDQNRTRQGLWYRMSSSLRR